MGFFSFLLTDPASLSPSLLTFPKPRLQPGLVTQPVQLQLTQPRCWRCHHCHSTVLGSSGSALLGSRTCNMSFVLLQLHRGSVSMCSAVHCGGAGQDAPSQFKCVNIRCITFNTSVDIGNKQTVQSSCSPNSEIYFSIGRWYLCCCVNCRGRPNDYFRLDV